MRIEWIVLEDQGRYPPLIRGRVYQGDNIVGELTLLDRKKKGRSAIWHRVIRGPGPISGTKVVETKEDLAKAMDLAERWVADGFPMPLPAELVEQKNEIQQPSMPKVMVSEEDLSPDQQEALNTCISSLEQGHLTILTGPAGCGKSTLVSHIIRRSGRHAVLVCPTGKAAQRLSQVTGLLATTIHRRLYSHVEEDEATKNLSFGKPRPPCLASDLLVVDEASMVGKNLYDELMAWVPAGARVLFVGDSAQLEPIKDTWGPDLKHPTAALTKVHRQAAGKPLIQLATAARQGLEADWLNTCLDESDKTVQFFSDWKKLLGWYLDRRLQGVDNVLITYTHAVRQSANQAVRQALKLEGPLCPGDRIMVRSNNYRWGLMNGEILTVTKVAPYYKNRFQVFVQGREEPILVNADLIEKEPNEFWSWWKALEKKDARYVHIWHGNCITVHSAQGSAWDEVGFIWCDTFKRLRKQRDVEARRFLYTAITRAAEAIGIAVV